VRSIIKKITHPLLKLGLNLYYSKPRIFCYDNICVKVHPDVFPPQLTFSTKILLDFISEMDLKNKTVLELGCGSGIISLLASKKGASVTASDINQTALDYLGINASKNNLKLKTVYSDLFQNLENQIFDYIIINPPYYPRKPKNIKEQAWFCGENFEYFQQLFLQLPHHLLNGTKCFMILSQDCDLEKIKTIADENATAFELVSEKRELVETNYIFTIKSDK
jgi:release factor glutamine methyltransferase